MQADKWARNAQRAAARWYVGETEVSIETWRAAMLAKAAQPGGIGSPEWARRVRRARWQGRIRHPARAARHAWRGLLLRLLDEDGRDRL